MSRPRFRRLLSVGRWELLYDGTAWIVQREDGKHKSWPTSLSSALSAMYRHVVVDNRFSQNTKNSMRALRNAIVQANREFECLLTPPKIEKITEIVRGDRQ